MTAEEVKKNVDLVCRNKTETQTLEIKEASGGAPSSLYDTLSAFSNQDEGGVILFGISERQGFAPVGVADVHGLQKRVAEQCEQMSPAVRAVFTVLEDDGKVFLTAEIPAVDIADRPCFYKGKGRIKGSWMRVGDADAPMTEYEVYSYEAFRKKVQDDIRPIERAAESDLDEARLEQYMYLLKKDRPHIARLERGHLLRLMSMVVEGRPTLAALQLFGTYPQAFFPNLCITAISVPGTEMGSAGENGERFLDNRRIEGTIPEMLEDAMLFIRRNMQARTVIDPVNGRHDDAFDFPPSAVREAVVNALVHRDYSAYTEGRPIQVIMYQDRMEIHSPGGLYGRTRLDQLGKVQPDTRNPVLAAALEVLGITENRYSGIPTIRRQFQEAGLPEPEFLDLRSEFCVTFRRKAGPRAAVLPAGVQTAADAEISGRLLEFCRTPRSRAEIAAFLKLSSVSYSYKAYVLPLLERGVLAMTLPDKPRSSKQRFVTPA